MIQFKSILKVESQLNDNEQYLITLNNHFQYSFDNIIKFLKSVDYINSDNIIQKKGNIATYIQETHCLAFTDLLVKYNYFADYNANEITALLSCFANIRVTDDLKILNISKLTSNSGFNSLLESITFIYDNYIKQELLFDIEPNQNINYMFEMVIPILEWCNSEDDNTCKSIMHKCQIEYNIFAGEFIKTILKINNMVNELKNVAEYICNVELLHKLSLISGLTLKFVATNQSLYV